MVDRKIKEDIIEIECPDCKAEFEIKYLVLEEMAKTSEDILFRRTKLGINFPKEKLPNLENILKKYL